MASCAVDYLTIGSLVGERADRRAHIAAVKQLQSEQLTLTKDSSRRFNTGV
jgi:hypothetical protein